MKIIKIISGGQTGVDQAVLQAAIDSDIDHGGWCPPGRVCESGKIPAQFFLEETPEERSLEAPDIPRSQRTEWNIRDADGTLIVLPDSMEADPGTAWAHQVAVSYGKTTRIIDPENADFTGVLDWILSNQIKVLGVGGPSEMTVPGIYDMTYRFMMKFFKAM